ncbi:MAG: aminopeptidase [Deltaproteobacteria bacterium]|nr:aminopeptidase [Deltaproteobacteria bacterium]
MMKEVLLMRGAKRIVEYNAGVKPGEKVLIITDFSEQIPHAQALAGAVWQAGAEPIISIIVPRKTPGQEPPELVAESMKKADVILLPLSISITHTPALKAALGEGARAIVLTDITDGLMNEGGIKADFEEVKPLCEKVAKLLTDTNFVTLTSPRGTHLTMSLEGRKGNAHTGLAREPGTASTVPDIEANISPVEESAEGVFVADGSIPYYQIGVLREPVVFTIKKGKVAKIEGGDQATTISNMMAAQNNPLVYNLAQLAFGLNPKCKMSGLTLDDEGVYGTAHIGIGTSIVLGGEVMASMHFDAVMWKPSLEADGKVVLKEGEWLI